MKIVKSVGLLVLGLAILCFGQNAFAQANILLNGGFEDGPGGSWTNATHWTSSDTWGGEHITNEPSAAYEGTKFIRINAFGSSTHVLDQRWSASAGQVYEVSGWMMSPATNRFSPTNGYCAVLLQFYDGSGAKIGVNCDTAHFREDGPSSWTRYSTGPVVAPAGTVTGRTLLLYYRGSPADATTNGWVYCDNVSVVTSEPTRAGSLLNPDFEVQPAGTLTNIPYWTAFGNAGAVISNYPHNGRFGLQIYWTETLLGQTWDVTPGYKYGCSGYVMTPSNNPARWPNLSAPTNGFAAILLEFLDATGGVVMSYVSQPFTETNYSVDVWTQLSVVGVAPYNAVSGRTMCAVLGKDTNFSGVVYFDDVSQALVSTGGTHSGLLENPGFDDGIPGNAYDLDATGELSAWKWYGGTNAGFIARDHVKDGEQSLVITWPLNMMSQDWPAESGRTYKAEGYLFTPSDNKFDSDGSSYGRLEMSFYVNGSTNPVEDAIYYSAPFTFSSPADTWIYFAVTGVAPAGVTVTGRLSCNIYSSDPEGDFDLAGVIYFDDLSVWSQGSGASAWEQWQMENFGSTNDPGTTGRQDDPDGDGYINWDEFIAGTQPTNADSLLDLNAVRTGSTNELLLRWASVAGRYYGIRRSTNTLASADFIMITNNIQATPPVNVYTDHVAGTWRLYYYRIEVRTNQW